MGTHSKILVPGVLAALLLGGLGCEDRVRPGAAPGPGNGEGPVSTILAPDEFDTVKASAPGFKVAFNVTDPDGIDSVWIWLEPNINTLVQYDAGGVPSFSVETSSIFVINDSTLHGDTLTVRVQARDVLGDTGVAAVRHLLIQ